MLLRYSDSKRIGNQETPVPTPNALARRLKGEVTIALHTIVVTAGPISTN